MTVATFAEGKVVWFQDTLGGRPLRVEDAVIGHEQNYENAKQKTGDICRQSGTEVFYEFVDGENFGDLTMRDWNGSSKY